MNTMSSMAVNKQHGIRRKVRISRKRKCAILLFLLYFGILFYFLFFSEKMGRTFVEREYHYNLVPFYEIKRFLKYHEVLGLGAVILNIGGNVAAFMQFGFFVPIFSRRCKYFLNTVYYSFELSLVVEIIQLVTKVGSFDVDDIILNTIGGALGYWVFRVADYIRKRNKIKR